MWCVLVNSYRNTIHVEKHDRLDQQLAIWHDGNIKASPVQNSTKAEAYKFAGVSLEDCGDKKKKS